MPPRLLTIVLCVLCMHCTRDPADKTAMPLLGIEPSAWSVDSAYVLLGDSPSLLIGFDLFGDTLDSRRLKLIVDQLQANGGNYLRVNKGSVDSVEFFEEIQRAIDLEIQVDTARAEPWARSVPGPRSFQHALLRGEGRLALGQFTQAGLNAIRAARTVERHIPFWSISDTTGILSRNNPTGARSGADGYGNYLIYIPRAGSVNLNLSDGRSGPRRVTVVGHLGTQRSEVLRPPYDSSFTLISNDDNGGWMIVELLND